MRSRTSTVSCDDSQIDRAVRQPTLTENLFVEALASSDLAKWRRTFSMIDAYAEKLQRLLDPER